MEKSFTPLIAIVNRLFVQESSFLRGAMRVYIEFMSKAFTRELDEQPEVPPVKLPSALPSGAKNYFTRQGIAKFQQEIQELNSKAASPANRQRIFEIKRSLESAVVVEQPPKPWRQISFGATVTVRDHKNEQHFYRIVGVDETDLDDNRISWLSPIAKALLNKRVGEHARFFTPDGEQVLEIMEVDFEE